MSGRSFSILLLAILVMAPLNQAFAEVTATFRYPLSNFSGPVLSQWAKLAVDQERNEIYALNRRANDIRIFNEYGMEIFVFGDGYASAADIAIGDDGDIFILSTGYQTATVHLLNYRGEHVSEIPLRNIPPAFSKFIADRLLYMQGSLYLVDSDALLVIVVDEKGFFEEGYDLNITLRPSLSREDRKTKTIENVDWAKKKLEYVALNGFTVDKQGNMFFTVPVLFAAFRLSPDGELAEFGRPGSGPGKFGVAAGIATDDVGYVYVADRLRSVVLVFDPSLKFQAEFGYRGSRPSNLIVPDDLAIDSGGNVYVGQAANRGVSVFRVVHQRVVHERAVPEAAGRLRRSDTTSRVLEKTAEIIEEDVPGDVGLVVDHGGDSTSRVPEVPEKSGRIIEEDVSDEVELTVDVSDQMEFIVDQGGDTASTDSENSGWTIEEDEFDHLEEIGNEE